jgi:hypothetical protein
MISEHSITALATRSGVTIPLNVLEATIGLDQNWSPYCQASLTVARQTAGTKDGDADIVLYQTDPFYNTRVQIYVQESYGASKTLGELSTLYTGDTLSDLTTLWTGLTLGDLTDLWYIPWNGEVISNERRLFNLKVRSSRIDLVTGNINLELAGDESLLFDDALLDTTPYAPNKLTAKTAVEFALSRIGAYLQAGASDAAITADASVWEPGDDSWGYLQSLLDAAGLRLYCDEERRWYLTDNYVTGNTQTVSYENDYLTMSQQTTLDGEFYSAAVVKYSWTDDLNVQQVAYDTYSNPLYNYRKVKRVEYNRRYPGPGAAKAMVNRKNQKSVDRTFQIINDYRYTPGDAIDFSDDVIYPPVGSTTPTGSVVGVSWSLPGDRMTITAKLTHYTGSFVFPAGGGLGGEGDIGTSNTDMGA